MGVDTDIIMEDAPRYAAFISYAHADAPRAAKLHRMLERYRPPPEFKERRERLRPVFRDTAELTPSHSLSDKIKAAVEDSRKLIVLCSPAAKKSHWVNEEIRLFRSLHGEESILCAIVEGVPDTAFPPALTEEGREPLAADLTGSTAFGKGESFRYGVLQLAASMLEVGLDALVRRDLKRRRRVGSAVVLGALAFSGVMGASTLSAIKAREAANANRAEAEDLVEYMITDLKTKLEPVGRLDILDGVGDKVIDYYKGQKIADMPDERIARYARAQHLLGQVALDEGRYDDAKTQIDAAYALTKEVLARNPEDTDAIFAHAQSAFWVGKVFRDQGNFQETKPYWQEYHSLAYSLYNIDPNDFDFIMEAGWGEANLGLVRRRLKDLKSAETHYAAAISKFEEALRLKPDSISANYEMNEALAGAEQTALAKGEYSSAIRLKKKIITNASRQLEENPKSFQLMSTKAHLQSNYLWQYALLLGDEDRKFLIGAALEPLERLHIHDPENVLWGRRYFWHLLLSEIYAPDELSRREAHRELMGKLYSIPEVSVSPAISFYVDSRRANNLMEKGDFMQAREIVREMSDDFLQSPKEYSSPEIILARLYAVLGDDESAKFYANSVVEKFSAKPSLLPTSILHLAQAEVILGRCELAKIRIRPILEVAPKVSQEIAKIIKCKT